MTLLHRSLIAATLAVALAGCNDDTSAPGTPFKPAPLEPLPPKPLSVAIGNAFVEATTESVVITPIGESEVLAEVESFKGISYAEPVRFKHSEYKPFEGEVPATTFGYACPQLKATNEKQDENCLNLNIWRPAGTQSDAGLPVYVFIHGGDFEYGSGSEPLIHGDTVVAQSAYDGNEFIMVTFNYRLGLLGTRWEKGANTNGNFGIGDQVTLLTWLHKYISDFGGNPDKITLMGQGAGAMSIALLQQQMRNGDLPDNAFDRAIMQSAPVGFEFPSYNARKARFDDLDLGKLPTDEDSLNQILDIQQQIQSPAAKLENWLLRNAGGLLSLVTGSESSNNDVNANSITDYLWDKKSYILNADSTPMSEFMPFSPYLECNQLKDTTFDKSSCESDMGKPQPVLDSFAVDTVIGVNSADSNTVAMLPSLVFAIPGLLPDDLFSDDQQALDNTLASILSVFADESSKQEFTQQLETVLSKGDDALPSELNLTAYNALIQLYLGLGNFDENRTLLNLTDYYGNREDEVGGVLSNMGQFKQLLNDIYFSGPARMVAANNEQAGNEYTAFYYFDYKPGFNVWTYNTDKDSSETIDIGDALKTISCISGACNGSELPFVFNKAMKLDGTTVRAGSKDKQMMNKLSRFWFSDELFRDYQYQAYPTDTVLHIDEEWENDLQPYWDLYTNEGIDPTLRDGRLQGLEELGLIGQYLSL